MFFSDKTQPLIDKAASIKCKKVKVLNVCVDVESVPFNKGFYSVDMTFYFLVELSVYLSPGTPAVNCCGISYFSKKVILYGSEANARVFSSHTGCCNSEQMTAMPNAVVQIVDPICLACRYVECPVKKCCPCSVIPAQICTQVGGSFQNVEVSKEDLYANQQLIKQALEDFSISIASIKATVGPTVTLYEIIPAAGVRISKIKTLEDDIALSLSALQIRIIAPMPGKGTIGIEVPNRKPQVVSMQSVIASRKFQECKYDLPVAMGRTITNEVFMFDLCKTPHLLVAGATGQGKSVGLNAIITSLLYKKHPAELKFVMVDPKMVEFSIYSKIERHYLAKLPNEDNPIVTEPADAVATLNSLVTEMENRYKLLVSANVRNIKEYNTKFISRTLNPNKGHRFLPYIVAVVDEFADLIITAGREIEIPISRIAAKARAVGIHMILATQRPDAKVITGTIKSNFPSRIAFKVASMIDSRTILDAPGANRLIGRGDMLIMVAGNDTVRVQCAFVDTPEVEQIVNFIGEQPGYPTAYLLPEYVAEGDGKNGGAGAVDMSDLDPLFDEAARLVVIQQQGSTSLIQRKFSIGYNRAGRVMDQLEAAGIVGPFEGSKARQVLVPDEFSLEQVLKDVRNKK